MNIKTLPRAKASGIFDSYFNAGKAEVEETNLPAPYLALRKQLLKAFTDSQEAEEYKTDLHFALKVYEIMNAIPEFNESVAANNDFWRYLCCQVVPDLIQKRHGLVDEYFFAKPYRIYLQALWWYIHLSYQGTLEKTEAALAPLNTDYIMNLVERSGRDGVYLPISRAIIKALASLPNDVRIKKVNGSSLFRRVMIQNTAKNGSFNLVLEGKTNEYVNMLFEACGVEVSL